MLPTLFTDDTEQFKSPGGFELVRYLEGPKNLCSFYTRIVTARAMFLYASILIGIQPAF